jgi:uncharacterized membrane protein YfcA
MAEPQAGAERPHLQIPEFNLSNAAFLFGAALVAGGLNAVAGGGSFIAFPTLLFTGVPPIPANATNTVALWTGLVGSGGAFRRHVNVPRRILSFLVGASVAGGICGALLLLRTPAHTFMRILPWLMLAATLLFIFGGKLIRPGATRVVHDAGTATLLVAACFQFFVSIYGGYFGGGMGIVILAMLTAFGMADIHHMNALKIVLSTATNGIAVVIFIVSRAVYWKQALVMIVGAVLGGYFGAHYSLRLPQKLVRWFVIAVGSTVTTYFFVRSYWPGA